MALNEEGVTIKDRDPPVVYQDFRKIKINKLNKWK